MVRWRSFLGGLARQKDQPPTVELQTGRHLLSDILYRLPRASARGGNENKGTFALPKFTVVVWVRKTDTYPAIPDELLELAEDDPYQSIE